MARKKYYNSKRPNSKAPQQQDAASTIPMAPSATPFRLGNCKYIVALSAFALAFCLITVLSTTHSSPRGHRFDVLSNTLHSVEVINEFPHDPAAFTQGLLYGGNDSLFESTGLYGRSSVRKVALQTGEVQAIQKMDDSYFGEGLTLIGERLFQVTWLQNTGFIYGRNDFSKFEKFTHGMKDGWGLATDGKIMFGTDGSSTLYQIDPQTMKVIVKHTVKYNGHEVPYLNELEYINGEVWANVWQTDCIARISYKDGTVVGWILLPNLRQGLLAGGNRGIDVLNGIAWDEAKQRIFVTGKLWPKLYEVKLHPIETPFNGDVEHLCIPR